MNWSYGVALLDKIMHQMCKTRHKERSRHFNENKIIKIVDLLWNNKCILIYSLIEHAHLCIDRYSFHRYFEREWETSRKVCKNKWNRAEMCSILSKRLPLFIVKLTARTYLWFSHIDMCMYFMYDKIREIHSEYQKQMG